MYGATVQFFLFLNSASLFVFLYFMAEFEHPAINEWNPFDTNTPRH